MEGGAIVMLVGSGRSRGLLVLLGLVGPTAALAGFDGAGAPPPVDSDEAADPLLTWRAVRPARGAFSLHTLFEAAATPLVRLRVDPATQAVEPEAVIGSVGGLRVGARYAVSDRVEVAASIPLWLAGDGETATRGLGDLSLSVPVGLAQAGVGRALAAVAVVPWLTLPTGASARYLGDRGPGVGVQAVGEISAGRLVGVAYLGLDVRSFEAEDNMLPGPGVRGGASMGLELDPRFGLHLGWRGDSRLRSLDPVDDAAPRRVGASEIALSARGVLFDRWYTTLGVGTLTQRGPGAADLRLWLGLGKSIGGRRSDAMADGPDTQVDEVPPAMAPVRVGVGVQDAEGRPLVASVRALPTQEGQTEPAPLQMGSDGPPWFQLSPGTWTLQAEVPGYGTQQRGVVLPAGGPGEDLLFIMLPQTGERTVELAVVDVDGRPVVGADLDVGGRPIGRTASAGTVQIGGLSAAAVQVDAQADTFRELTRPDIAPGDEPVELVLARERGAVQVVVRDPSDQPISDASARFVGADQLGPFQVGDGGERTFVLRPGPWQLLVTSPVHGVQQRRLDIAERDTAMQVVQVVLQPPEEGATDLSIRVLDADNNPVPDVRVSLDGLDFGTTSSGGELSADDLREGPRTLSISGPYLRPFEEPIFLSGGLQEHTVVASYKPGTTMILARGPRGMVDDATARFNGPQVLPTTPLGRDGVEVVSLAPGPWQVLVSSPSLGVQQQGVLIPEDSRTLHVVEAVLNPGEAGEGRLTVQVVDPEGRPVSGASIALDGDPLGTTSTSGTVSLVELATGPRALEVTLPPYAPNALQVDVGTADSVQQVALGWGVGAVRVSVHGDGLPATEARLRLGGGRFVPATPVDAQGRRLFSLEPGPWQVLASSPRFAPGQVAFEVPDQPGLTEVDVDLSAPVAGVAEALVRVQDPNGRPIPGAQVLLDDQAAIPTGQGGLVVLQTVPGTHRIQVQAPRFQSAVFDDVVLGEGVVERILPLAWTPRPIVVRVVGPSGPLAGAQVQVIGPSQVEPSITDARGQSLVQLHPGAWRILASAPDLGTQVVQHVEPVDADDEAATVTLTLRAAQVEVTGSDITVEDTIYFDTGKATLTSASTPILDEVAATLQAHPELVRLVVEGHTDPTGGVAFNMELSRDRARAVVQALVARGIAPERLVARGYGPTRPVADNDTESGRADNRRVQLKGEVGDPSASPDP